MPRAHAFRLPTSVTPERYDIEIAVDPDTPDFRGTVRIALHVEKPVSEVVLHGRDLVVDEATIEQGGKARPVKVVTEAENEALRFTTNERLQEGTAVLVARYTGKIGRAMAGLYLSEDGPERCLVTQCEATDARAIFPCFDEPAFKANLAWSVIAPDGQDVLANGVLAGKEPGPRPGTTRWRFAPTPPVSSYLAAIAVGPFGATEPRKERGIEHRVLAMKGKERFGEHARDFAARTQAWYEDYFDVPYHFAKYDQIAVPSFSFGAMENPGLVVFRASLLLLDPKSSAWRDRKSVDRVVAHEAAHMWFGNYVTMQWWDDLWLNEAFAEWVAHKCVDELEPGHDIWHLFQGATDRALATDALAGTHPIHTPVATPEEAQELFDSITYGKGSAVMRMMEGFLGEEAFRQGLRTYMKEFKESNARGADLWNHLKRASGLPVDRIMQAWVSRPGHPLVRAALRAREGPARIQLIQERAYVLPGQADNDPPWPVPIVLRYRDDEGIKEQRHLLEEREATLDLDAEGELRWCVVNARDAGFYRAALDESLARALIDGYEELDATERRGLLRDQWFLVKRGEAPPGLFLDLLDRAAPTEAHYAVTSDLVAYASGIENLLEKADSHQALAALAQWCRERFTPQLEALGMEARPEESPQDAERRSSLLRAFVGIGAHRDHLESVRRVATRERADPGSVDAEIAGTCVGLAMRHGDAAHYDEHLGTYRKRRDAGESPQRVERYLYTLPAARKPDLTTRTLSLLEDGTVPKQGIGPILRIMLGEAHTQDAAWRYVKGNWATLKEKLGDPWSMILIDQLGSMPPRYKDEVVAFLDSLEGYAGESQKRARETLRIGEHIHKHVLPGIEEWLTAR
jgi:puromycin-sensitive aminopeptidase